MKNWGKSTVKDRTHIRRNLNVIEFSTLMIICCFQRTRFFPGIIRENVSSIQVLSLFYSSHQALPTLLQSENKLQTYRPIQTMCIIVLHPIPEQYHSLSKGFVAQWFCQLIYYVGLVSLKFHEKKLQYYTYTFHKNNLFNNKLCYVLKLFIPLG